MAIVEAAKFMNASCPFSATRTSSSRFWNIFAACESRTSSVPSATIKLYCHVLALPLQVARKPSAADVKAMSTFGSSPCPAQEDTSTLVFHRDVVSGSPENHLFWNECYPPWLVSSGHSQLGCQQVHHSTINLDGSTRDHCAWIKAPRYFH